MKCEIVWSGRNVGRSDDGEGARAWKGDSF
jgi:hypothetical protein